MAKKKNKNQENRNDKLKIFVIEFTHSDGDTVKYIINRRNFYEAKEEAEFVKEDYNNGGFDTKITNFFVKEATK
jgi:hypothetical protein